MESAGLFWEFGEGERGAPIIGLPNRKSAEAGEADRSCPVCPGRESTGGGGWGSDAG